MKKLKVFAIIFLLSFSFLFMATCTVRATNFITFAKTIYAGCTVQIFDVTANTHSQIGAQESLVYQNQGDTIKYVCNAAQGASFVKWQEVGSSTVENTSRVWLFHGNVPIDTTFYAIFSNAPLYPPTYNMVLLPNGGNGTIMDLTQGTQDSGSGVVNLQVIYGDMVQFWVTPPIGANFANWTYNQGANVYTYMFNPETFSQVSASFSMQANYDTNTHTKHTLIVDSGGHGTITWGSWDQIGANGLGEYTNIDEGTLISLNAVPNSGYIFSYYTVSAGSYAGIWNKTANLEISLDANMTITAYFVEVATLPNSVLVHFYIDHPSYLSGDIFWLSVPSVESGYAGTYYIPSNETVTVICTADRINGWVFDHCTIVGNIYGADVNINDATNNPAEYKFTGETTITAYFVQGSPTLAPSATPPNIVQETFLDILKTYALEISVIVYIVCILIFAKFLKMVGLLIGLDIATIISYLLQILSIPVLALIILLNIVIIIFSRRGGK